MTETERSTLIHTVEKAENKALFFEILSVGADVEHDHPELQPGRFFYTGRYAEGWLNFPGHPDWYFINAEDAVGLAEFDEEIGEIEEATK